MGCGLVEVVVYRKVIRLVSGCHHLGGPLECSGRLGYCVDDMFPTDSDRLDLKIDVLRKTTESPKSDNIHLPGVLLVFG